MAVVATQPSTSTIAHAARYWLEILPYTATFATLPGTSSGTQNAVPLFSQLQGWQAAANPATAIALERVGLTPITGVQLQVLADGHQRRWDTGAWPWNLEELATDAWAIRSLSAQLVNTTATTYPNVQVRYRLIVWEEPIAMRVLQGWSLTQPEVAVARAVGLSVQPTTMRGTHPLPLDTVIAETYRNRLIAPPLDFSYQVTPGPSSLRFHVSDTKPGELLVLRAIAVAANPEDGVTITVDRDSDLAHVEVAADAASWQRPITCLVPALHTLAFSVQATTQLTAPIPIRLQIWRLALSNVLSVRLHLEDEEQLAQAIGAPQAKAFIQHVRAGVI